MRGELPPRQAAADYARQLRQFASQHARSAQPEAWPRLDLAILGLGSDGHTASLFPGPIDPAELTAPVRAVRADYGDRPAERITLTPLVFNAARNVWFLVAGVNKAQAVAAVLTGDPAPERWPAQRIRPALGQVVWFLDESAASEIPE